MNFLKKITATCLILASTMSVPFDLHAAEVDFDTFEVNESTATFRPVQDLTPSPLRRSNFGFNESFSENISHLYVDDDYNLLVRLDNAFHVRRTVDTNFFWGN